MISATMSVLLAIGIYAVLILICISNNGKYRRQTLLETGPVAIITLMLYSAFSSFEDLATGYKVGAVVVVFSVYLSIGVKFASRQWGYHCNRVSEEYSRLYTIGMKELREIWSSGVSPAVYDVETAHDRSKFLKAIDYKTNWQILLYWTLSWPIIVSCSIPAAIGERIVRRLTKDIESHTKKTSERIGELYESAETMAEEAVEEYCHRQALTTSYVTPSTAASIASTVNNIITMNGVPVAGKER